MAAKIRSRQHVARRCGTPAPIIVLPLAAPASDDRTFNTWADFLRLLPLMDDADRCETDEAVAGG